MLVFAKDKIIHNTKLETFLSFTKLNMIKYHTTFMILSCVPISNYLFLFNNFMNNEAKRLCLSFYSLKNHQLN